MVLIKTQRSSPQALFDLVRAPLTISSMKALLRLRSEKIVYEVRYDFPGWPRIIEVERPDGSFP